MKLKLLYLPVTFAIATALGSGGCEKESPAVLDDQRYHGKWNLVNVSGGFAGVDENFAWGEVEWEFGNTLSIQKDLASETLHSGPGSGTYTYDVFEAGGKVFLSVDKREFAGATLRSDTLILDQNQRSVGSGADMFVYMLVR